jgi:subtilisin family serine protease
MIAWTARAICAAALLAATALPAVAQRATVVAPAVPGSVLVKFRTGTSARAVAAANAPAHAAVRRSFARLGLQHVRTSLPVEQALKIYRSNPQVEYAEPDYLVRGDEAVFPDDDRFAEMWNLHNTGQTGGTPDADIDAPEAWATQPGHHGVVVAVIDSGIDYAHPDLVANLYRNDADCDADGDDDDGNGHVDDCHGIDTRNGDGDPMDDHGHGTHVAGTIGAAGRNALGVTGVAWHVSLLACKFLDADLIGSVSGAIACLDYVAGMRERGVNVVATSNSWGLGEPSRALDDAIATSGVLFLASAGNTGADTATAPRFPCNSADPTVVCVAATSNTDTLASYSNYGRSTVDLAAPGNAILSTWPGGDYRTLSGTSMATPHVTGVAALLHAEFAGLSTAEARCRLLAGADRLTSLARKTVSGGRLNAAGALATRACGATPEWPVVSGVLQIGDAPAAGLRVTLVNATAHLRAHAVTDGTGHAAIESSGPGTYRLLVRDITTAAAAPVDGRLAVDSGPLAQVEVRLHRVGVGLIASTRTDATGAFDFGDVAAGTYRVSSGSFPLP